MPDPADWYVVVYRPTGQWLREQTATSRYDAKKKADRFYELYGESYTVEIGCHHPNPT